MLRRREQLGEKCRDVFFRNSHASMFPFYPAKGAFSIYEI
jgi:hypothetical protein